MSESFWKDAKKRMDRATAFAREAEVEYLRGWIDRYRKLLIAIVGQ